MKQVRIAELKARLSEYLRAGTRHVGCDPPGDGSSLEGNDARKLVMATHDGALGAEAHGLPVVGVTR